MVGGGHCKEELYWRAAAQESRDPLLRLSLASGEPVLSHLTNGEKMWGLITHLFLKVIRNVPSFSNFVDFGSMCEVELNFKKIYLTNLKSIAS